MFFQKTRTKKNGISPPMVGKTIIKSFMRIKEALKRREERPNSRILTKRNKSQVDRRAAATLTKSTVHSKIPLKPLGRRRGCSRMKVQTEPQHTLPRCSMAPKQLFLFQQ